MYSEDTTNDTPLSPPFQTKKDVLGQLSINILLTSVSLSKNFFLVIKETKGIGVRVYLKVSYTMLKYRNGNNNKSLEVLVIKKF